MFVFSPTCPYCKRNWPVWTKLVRDSQDNRLLFVNIGGPLKRDFSEVYSFGGATVIAKPDLEGVLKYGLLETPIALLISATGKCEKVWVGEITPSDLKEITSAAASRSM